MEISKKIISKFQAGGPAPTADPAAAQGAPQGDPNAAAQGGGDPIAQLLEMAQQALQGQDCQSAMSVCQAFISLVQGSQGGGQPQDPAAAGQPVYRAGGKLVKRVTA